MTKQDIDNIIMALCPNDEDFERPCISPAYLKRELEALALDLEPTTKPKNDDNLIDKIMAQINTPNRGTCDYFIVDKIEEIIMGYREE